MKVENKKHLRAKSFHHILQPRLIVKFELKLNDECQSDGSARFSTLGTNEMTATLEFFLDQNRDYS